MPIYDSTSLNRELEDFLYRVSRSRLLRFNEVFQLLFLTGLRLNELQFFDEWLLIGDSHVTVRTSKNGNYRNIPKSSLPPLVLQSVLVGERLFYLPKDETIRSAFNFVSANVYRVGGKNVSTHIFRHNYIKQLSLKGFSNSEIAANIGLLKVATVSVYLNSIVSSKIKVDSVNLNSV